MRDYYLDIVRQREIGLYDYGNEQNFWRENKMMENIRPILSICIPTYNRSACLQECLESVLLSAKGHEGGVEIVVSDNASTDETETVVNEFRKRSPRIRYHRNDTNIGAERNFYVAAGLASGEYIWLLGDDDKMTEGAIPSVLSRINAGYNLIVCNFSMWSRDFSGMKKQSFFSISQDKEFDDPNALMKTFGISLGYISSVIMKREVFFSVPIDEYERYVETFFPFLYAVYTGIVKNGHATYISAPLVCNRSGNAPTDYITAFVIGSSLVLEALLAKGFTQNAVHSAKHQLLKKVSLWILCRKLLADANLKGVASWLRSHYRRDWLTWAVCMPILYAPVPPLLVWMARRIKEDRPDDPTGLWRFWPLNRL